MVTMTMKMRYVVFPEDAWHVEDESEDARSGTHPPCRRVHVHLKSETSSSTLSIFSEQLGRLQGKEEFLWHPILTNVAVFGPNISPRSRRFN